MKKLFALVLALMMVMACFAACGTTNNNAADNGNKTNDPAPTDPKKEVITVGYTLYDPMNYEDENGELIGFDTELAKAVFGNMGYEVNFQLIDWNAKYTDLESGAIDCVWNGYIDVADEYTVMATLEDSDLLTYTETSISAATQIPEASSISEDFDLLDSVDDSEIKHYVDVYAFNQDFLNQITWDEAALHTWDYTEINYVWGIDIE